MKKIILLMLVLCVVPFAYASATDFSQHYMQSNGEWSLSGAFSTTNSKLLRSTAPDTDMNYGLSTWGSCSVTLGGSELGGIPITISDLNSNYQHRSYMVAYPTNIKQYGSDCSVLDTFSLSTNETFVSKIGAIRPYSPSGGNYIEPTFGITMYNNYTGYTYMKILKLDEETSLLKLEKDVLISSVDNFSDTEEIFGTIGGCTSSLTTGCIKENRYFGVYNDDDNTLHIVYYGTSGWDLRTQLDVGETYINNIPNTNQLFFDDWDGDGNNEFIFLGASSLGGTYYAHIKRVVPTAISPYYQDIALDSKTIEALYNANITNANLIEYQSMNLCQLGTLGSELEVCFSVPMGKVASQVNWTATGIIDNTFNAIVYDITQDKSVFAPFTYDKTDDGDWDAGNWIGCIYWDAVDDYRCFNESLGVEFADLNINPVTLGGSQNQYEPQEIIVTDLDGDTTLPELITSDGGVQTFNFTAGSLPSIRTDWNSVHDSTYFGEIIVQDISNDEKNELIYIDETNLRIYSNDNTAFSLMNWTYEEGVSNGSISTGSSVDSGTISGVTSTTPEEFVDNLNSNLSLILGLTIITVLIIIVVMAGVKNPLILIIVGIFGTIISTSLGLISSSVLVIIIISMVVLLLLGFTIFGKR